MEGLEGFLFSFFNLEVMARYWPAVAQGFLLTVILAGLIIVTGLVSGVLLACLRSLGIRPLNWTLIVVVDLFRALPPLVVIMLLFFGLPTVGVNFSGFAATWLALSLILMSFAEEVCWAGITAVSRGQWEAARSTGLGFVAALRLVVLPQALRMAIPPLTSRAISITKGTALGSAVGVSEILGAAQSAMAFSSNPSPLTLGAIAYAILFTPMIAVGRWIEGRYSWKR
ncbi:amino acid ABC transporter permease [Roseomonas sp. OT10]|uniref:amino acid ABC transporter permease n=1 Tax=Roseomonas cutis TaxID=2897332 RepID=UPI001E4D7273|nr:amino acid ABC transporter permease [Roseomonas sp. OT10]UFN48497.1 amino acid ABC transporter permease [Roseomonas sp. OT10]